MQAKIHSLSCYQVAATLNPILWMRLVEQFVHFGQLNFELRAKIMHVIEFRDDIFFNAII